MYIFWVCESVSPRVRESTNPHSAEYIRPTDSVERPCNNYPSSSGRSGSTLSGGAANHKFSACFAPPNLVFYCCARLCMHLWCFSCNKLGSSLLSIFPSWSSKSDTLCYRFDSQTPGVIIIRWGEISVGVCDNNFLLYAYVHCIYSSQFVYGLQQEEVGVVGVVADGS